MAFGLDSPQPGGACQWDWPAPLALASRAAIDITTIAVSVFTASATEFINPPLTVGKNLEAPISIALSTPAPKGGMEITVTSADPNRLLFSLGEDQPGTPVVTVGVREGVSASREFMVHSLGNSGTATYRVTGPGCEPKDGTVTLAPSGILLSGPGRLGNPIATTSGGFPVKLTVMSAMLDPSHAMVAVQQVRGGFKVAVKVRSSDATVAAIMDPTIELPGGSASAVTQMKPAKSGTTTLSVDAPEGFDTPAQFNSVAARVLAPNLSVTQDVAIGKDLEISGQVVLGELAPPSGLVVTLRSRDPKRLLLSKLGNEAGAESIQITIAPGGVGGAFCLQALGDSGTVSYTATATGFREKEATLTLAPSGVVLAGPAGAPDEAEILRPNAPVGPNGFFTTLAAKEHVKVVAYLVQLNPTTRRGADITVQALRAGLHVKVDLKNSNPSVGTVAPFVMVEGGQNQGFTDFVPKSLGTTVVSVVTPAGFTQASNATELTCVVKQ